MEAQSRVRQLLAQAFNGILEIRIVGPGEAGKNLLVELRTPRNQGSNQRGSHTAPHIAHEINDARHGIIFFWRDSDVGDQSNGHKQKSQTNNLHDAQPHRGIEADRQVDTFSGVKHRDG